MNVAISMPPPPSRCRLREDAPFSPIRAQAASLRALLDEVERAVPHGGAHGLHAQLVEELARLGCRFLVAASALSTVVDPGEAHDAT
jgi:hypothetical protein